MTRFILAAAALFSLTATAAAQSIGVAAIVENDVRGAAPGAEAASLSPGSGLVEDEIVTAASDSRAQLLFLDETTLTVGPQSTVTLDAFVFDAERGAGRVALDLGVGVFRFITGRSAASVDYAIRTPTAQLGVRGTVFDVIVKENGETWVILREGAVDLNAIGGAVQRLDVAGLASSVAAANTTPTVPAPPPPAIAARAEAVSGFSDAGDGEDETTAEAMDARDIACGFLDCRSLREYQLSCGAGESGSSSGSSGHGLSCGLPGVD